MLQCFEGLKDWPAAWPHAVVVRSIHDVEQACAQSQPLVIASPPGAALFAGVGWWRALAARARARFPTLIVADVLDCADAPGLALAAIRMGLGTLVLAEDSPGFDRVASIAAAHGVLLLKSRTMPRDRKPSLR